MKTNSKNAICAKYSSHAPLLDWSYIQWLEDVRRCFELRILAVFCIG